MPETATRRARRYVRSSRAAVRLAPWLLAALGRGAHGVLTARAARHPDRPFLLAADEAGALAARWTYGEAHREVNRLARWWRARGIRHGHTAALALGNRPETVLHTLALARLGASAALLDPAWATQGGAVLDHALRVTGSQAPVTPETPTDGRIARRLPPGLSMPTAPYLRLFTSGTTGLPKAAPVSHLRYVMAGAGLHTLASWLGPDDVVFSPMPLHHASAQVLGVGMALVAGCAFATAPRFSARNYWAQANAVGATMGLYIGELCRYLLAAPEQPSERRHRVHTFLGNGLRPDVWPGFQARFGVERVLEFYGATEGPAFLLNRDGQPGHVGRPLVPWPFHGHLLVQYDVENDRHPRDRRGRMVPCRTGETGELLVRLSALPFARFEGYSLGRGRDPATDEKILRGVRRRGDRYFRTGDLLVRGADGAYAFVDRVGDTYRWKGENVSTQQVADVLGRALPDGTPVTVYGVEVPGHEGRAGMAAIGLEGGSVDWRAVHAAASALPPAARPVFARALASLPSTATGKLQKRALQAEGWEVEGVRMRDDRAGSYTRVDEATRARLRAATARL